jgi:hypothetical protein
MNFVNPEKRKQQELIFWKGIPLKRILLQGYGETGPK